MMLYVILAYLMLFAALFNAVCQNNAFFATDFFKWFLFSWFVLGYWNLVCLFKILSCIMHSALNLLVFLFYVHTGFLMLDYVLSGEIALKNINYFYYYHYYSFSYYWNTTFHRLLLYVFFLLHYQLSQYFFNTLPCVLLSFLILPPSPLCSTTIHLPFFPTSLLPTYLITYK